MPCNPTDTEYVTLAKTMSNPIKFGLVLLGMAIAAVLLFKLIGVVLAIAFKLAIIGAVGFVLWGLLSAGAKALSGRDPMRLP